MGSLASELFLEIRPGFLRVLAGSNGPVYVDVLDALEREASERHEGMSREEALTIVADVLSRHPAFRPDDAEVGTLAPDSLPLAEAARRVLDHLAKAETGWVLDEQLPNWDRVIRLDAHAIILIDALRQIARPDAAVFTDKLQGVCVALANHGAFADAPLAHLENCLTLARSGIAELRGIEKGLVRLTGRQREAKTLGEVYGVIFDQYAEQIGRTCYAELVRAQLPRRLDEAREQVRVVQGDVDLLRNMQHEVMRRDPSAPPAAAMARVQVRLDELGRTLDLVQPLADEIDRRTAEFARRSLARSRYLQEVVGDRREQVKNLFERINVAYAGRRLSDLNDQISLPPLLLPEARILAGRDSLYEPPRRWSLEENAPVDDDVSEGQRDRAKAQLRAVVRESLTVARANRFVDRLGGGKGARIASADFPVLDKDDLADVIAVLLHAESDDARYRVAVPADRSGRGDPSPAYDRKLDCLLERFFVVKK
ncbi:MAG TPA: Wadjet anti-phage system protein JetA family protein [Tepidisphaeraceae bacterium]|nr:Wadjet anti-phage system protein JetA family protein [Tepidisphaeraceae bacterium]